MLSSLSQNAIVNWVLRDPFAWAWKCYNEVNEELHFDYKTAKKLKKLVVVVYGPSQVGKTTLILHLLGVKYSSELEKLLRGKREEGRSSTSCAILYTKSGDGCFHLSPDPLNPKDETTEIVASLEENSKVTDFLIAWRENIESGRDELFPPRFLKIGIPEIYFDESEVDQDFAYTLIDVPGVDSAESKEYKYVHKLCEEFVFCASGIICVSTVDNLGALCPSARSSLKNWYQSVENYLFVTTYSFARDSFVKYFENAESYEALQERIFDGVETFRDQDGGPWIHSPISREECSKFFYPMDLGESFKKRTVQKEKAVEFLNEATQKLKGRVASTVSSLNHLKAIFSYKDRYEKDCDRNIEEQERKIKKCQGKIKIFRDKIEESEDRCCNFNNTLKKLRNWTRSYKKCSKQRFFLKSVENADEKLDDYLEYCSAEVKKLEEQIQNITMSCKLESLAKYCVDQLSSANKSGDINEIKSEWNEFENQIKQKLQKRFEDECIPKEVKPAWGKNFWFKSDREKFINWVSEELKKLKAEYEKKLRAEARKVVKILESTIKSYESKMHIDKEFIQNQKKKKKRFEEILVKYNKELELLKIRKSLLPNAAKIFVEKLSNERCRVLKKIEESLKKYPSGEETLIGLIAEQQVNFVFNQLTKAD